MVPVQSIYSRREAGIGRDFGLPRNEKYEEIQVNDHFFKAGGPVAIRKHAGV